MYDELKNKTELRKAVTHITLSITVLTTIAVIIRLFTKNPPESWVSSLILPNNFDCILYGAIQFKIYILKVACDF